MAGELKFEIELNLRIFGVKFELNLKVFEVFKKKIFWFPLLLDSSIRGFIEMEYKKLLKSGLIFHRN